MATRKRRKKFNSLITKEDLLPKELIDKVSLWALRILFKLGGHKEFVNKDNYISEETLVTLFDAHSFIDTDEEKYTRDDILEYLFKQYETLEKQRGFTTLSTLEHNLQKLQELLGLNSTEIQILEFLSLAKQYEVLDAAISCLGNELNTSQAKKALSVILDIESNLINEALSHNGILATSSMLVVDNFNTNSLERKFDFLSNKFIDNLVHTDIPILEMLKDIIRPVQESELSLEDYSYLKKDSDAILSYLQYAMLHKEKGVNILLYGKPGTGKTEITKIFAKKLGVDLYEISYADEENEAMDGVERVRAYKSAQAFLQNRQTLLMYDEAEDIFDSNSGDLFAPASRQKDKAWINRMLENNMTPTIWITNNIYAIDDAIVRRFDYVLEMPIPTKKQRKKIITKYAQKIVDEKMIKHLAKNHNIAPALIARTAKVVKHIETKNTNKLFKRILNHTLKAQGYGILQKPKKEKKTNQEDKKYSLSFINTDADIKQVAQGIKAYPNARVCLYGSPGTGKSAFGKHIAKLLNKPLIIKKGSDLLSMYVGGTEKNIANAFAEAKKKKAVLVFDEVDSFLNDRTQAQRSWEVTQVNEMLVQMENFDGVFIATTNLMDNLDKASLRRFDLKLEFKALKPEQAWEIFKEFACELKLPKIERSLKKDVANIKQLTPGDFAAVMRQNRFNPIKDTVDFIARLKNEVAVKNVSIEKVMGFAR